MNKFKNGFTLTELIVAMVISGIILVMMSYFIISFTNTSKNIKALQNKTYEQSVVVRCFEKFSNAANLAGSKVLVANNQDTVVLYSIEENMEVIEIVIDNNQHSLTYNSNTYEFEIINKIDVKKNDNDYKSYIVDILFDDESSYQFSIYFIAKEESN